MDKPSFSKNRGRVLWLPLIIMSLVVLSGCCNCPKAKESAKESAKTEPLKDSNKEEYGNKIGDNKMNKPVIIYKTKSDYYDKVPVILTEDKKSIVSYPSISDIYFRGKPALPFRLRDGYLLDNRGINPNTGFLIMSYIEFSQLKDSPSAADLNRMLLDRDPFKEIWLCGNRDELKEEVKELNELIGKGFPGCKRVK